MSDISKIAFVSATPIAPAQNYQPPAPKTEASQPEAVKTTPQPANDDAKTESDAQQRVSAQHELENVISVSSDGDTVQASEEALDQLEKEEELGGRVIAKPAGQEKSVAQERIAQQVKDAEAASEKRAAEIKKEEAAKEQRAEARKENDAEESAKANITSYNGYTDTQLEQLYLKGDISKQDYDDEIASREATREQQKSQNAAFAEEESKNVAQQSADKRDAQELKNYDRNDEPNPLNISERASIIQNLQQQNADPFANITTN